MFWSSSTYWVEGRWPCRLAQRGRPAWQGRRNTDMLRKVDHRRPRRTPPIRPPRRAGRRPTPCPRGVIVWPRGPAVASKWNLRRLQGSLPPLIIPRAAMRTLGLALLAVSSSFVGAARLPFQSAIRAARLPPPRCVGASLAQAHPALVLAPSRPARASGCCNGRGRDGRAGAAPSERVGSAPAVSPLPGAPAAGPPPRPRRMNPADEGSPA